MNRSFAVFWLLLLPVCLHSFAGLAATCSAGANCHACKNCSACKHCATEGGTYSVCRPDLYRQTFVPASPSRARTPRRESAPVFATARVTPHTSASAGHDVSLDADLGTILPPSAPPARQAPPSVPQEFTARCIGVTDGNTLRVLLVSSGGKREIKIRLYGIDAPELDQAYGTQAKKALSNLAFGKTLKVYSKGHDRYGGLLAWLFVGSTPINGEMVKAGAAWWYQEYAPNEKKLGQLQEAAKAEKRGLWKDEKAVALTKLE
jgi:endonuclease YncB( thermonuclease family)